MKRWRQTGRTVLLAGCILLAMSEGASAEVGLKLTLNGRELTVEPAPVNQEGTILVPLRLIFEEMGATVNYDPDTGLITGARGVDSVELKVGSFQAKRNGGDMSLEQAPVLIGEKTYVPARFVAEAFGAEVSWDGAASTVHVVSADRTLEHTEELGALNDRKKPTHLAHQGNARLLWYWQDESPHNHFSGYAGEDGNLYFPSHKEVLTLSREGKLLGRKPLDTDRLEMATTIRTSNGFKISIKNGDKTYSWTDIPLPEDSNSSFPFPNNKDYSFVYALLDRENNLILVDKEGLAAYAPDGRRLWGRKEWTDPSGRTVSAKDRLWGGAVDSQNNFYLTYAQNFVVLNSAGELQFAKKGLMRSSIMEDGTILTSGSAFRVRDGKPVPVGQSYSNGGRGYESKEGENTVSRADPNTGAVQWTYTLPEQELNMGYSLFNSTLTSDKAGNMYISTTGGSLHSLDQEGNLRFILQVDNKTISSAEVIPLSASECVVVVNNAILFLKME
ncbi:copper amine oxidase N-terminal domain-containing protein [Paenibacillus mesotrionivorans]|uniref:Copper amine oxidase N-terminal domain-containing protein n=1 Tax=Paenibacillus mesotrionivorans TaxID=3160968 RepID=A0ACC7NWQ2_9BACL